tara:strand:+ start:478 stop:1506 length:1029 start_codon:yes stop_codon:yes gene_type:complete
MYENRKEFLVARNDKIGDFMLIWPALAWLKKNIPNAHIVSIVSQSSSELAQQCPYIDDYYIDMDYKSLKKSLSKYNFVASITFFSTLRIGFLLKKLNIPIRIAPKNKIAQYFHNYRIKQNRSKSEKPEFEYNIDLVYELLNILNHNEILDADSAPFWVLDSEKHNQYKEEFIQKHEINLNKKIIFIHPGSGGSSKTLSLDQFIEICEGLRTFDDYNFIINCTESDSEKAEYILKNIASNVKIQKIKDSSNVSKMVNNIACSDLFIAGSTGPLHIAGALNKKTVGFYPSKKSSTSLRWQTINNFHKRLSITDTNQNKKNITIDSKKTVLEIQKLISSEEIIAN